MFDTSMKAELFVDLSNEQQQFVAGGQDISIGRLKDKLSTYFHTDTTATLLNVDQQSGPQGSTNLQRFQQQSLAIDTAAFKDLFAS